MAKVNPIQIQKFLAGIGYPASKDEIINHARSKGADDNTLKTLARARRDEFETPAEVSQAIGNIE